MRIYVGNRRVVMAGEPVPAILGDRYTQDRARASMKSPKWIAISQSAFDWEREALDFLRSHLPDHEPWRAWANFEFIDDEGRVNEVDLLVLTPAGLLLVEIKSRPGTIEGDAHSWNWTTDGRR